MNILDNKINGAQQEGNRDERILKALLPQNIPIDNREMQDWLAFLAKAAQLVRYSNPENELEGNWSIFLEKNPSVFLSTILVERPQNWDNTARKHIRNYYAAWNIDGKQAAGAQLLQHTIATAQCLNKWFCDAELLLQWEKESPVTLVLEKAIQADLGESLRNLRDIAVILQRRTTYQWLPLQDPFEAFHPVWALYYAVAEQPFSKNQDITQLDDAALLDIAVEAMRKIFQRLHFTLAFIVGQADTWFQQSLTHKRDHDPFIGLLLAFLQIFRHARDQLNTYPVAHLHYYYFDVLEQQQRPAVPDQTVVCFTLADHAVSCHLEKGTLLLADTNPEGLASHYATQESIVLSKARIVALKTLYVSRYNTISNASSYRLVHGMYAADVANSSDGKGLPFHTGDPTWPVFGEEQLDKNSMARRMSDAEIGFVIAAPIFALCEGQREIDLAFRFTSDTLAHLFDLFADLGRNTGKSIQYWASQIFSDTSFSVYASGAQGWFLIKHWNVDASSNWLEHHTLTLTLTIPQDEPAITNNNPNLTGTALNTDRPLIKIVLNPNHTHYLYSFTGPLQLEEIGIETRVIGIKSLTLVNELGLLDGSSPFAPFGSMPTRNAYCLLGHIEFFKKKLTDLAFQIEWSNLPDIEGGFAEYYREYPAEVQNSSFQVQLSAISNHRFNPSDTEQQQKFTLFNSEANDVLSPLTEINSIDLGRLQVATDHEMQQLPDYSNAIRSGYFKLQLCQPAMAFGHQEYPRLFAEAMLAQARPVGLMERFGKKETTVKLPREPYTPIISKIRASYTAQATLNMRPLESGNNDLPAGEKVFSLHPFGMEEIFAQGKVVSNYLLPQYNADGYLYIGLTDVTPGQHISMLFHIQDSKQKITNTALDIEWTYLHSNRWQPMGQEMLLADHTNRFCSTGMVQIDIPQSITTEHTIMPAGLFWVRVSAKGNLAMVGRLLSIETNAVGVVWKDNGDEQHFDAGKVLPPIKELVLPRPEIAQLTQPFGFWGGQPKESLPDFYVRTSERLRHKNRAITRWDIAHLVMERFPFVSGVKCITCNEHASIRPGELLVVAIAQNLHNEPDPLLGLHQLTLIRDFLKEKTSVFAQIMVTNPVYEKIVVHCTIRLTKGLEQQEGVYSKQLHQELELFICPWLVTGTVQLGGSIRKNEVLAFIKSRPYVQFVTQFSLIKIFEQIGLFDTYDFEDTALPTESTEILSPELPWSVFTPVQQHKFAFTTEEKHLAPEVASIENMRLETSFIVLGDTETPPPDEAIFTQPPAAEDWYLVAKKHI